MAEDMLPPSAGESAPAATPVSDADVAQGYFDNEISSIHSQLDELKQAMAHLAESVRIGENSNGGHRTEQSQTGTPAGEREEAGVSASAGGGGQQVSGAAEIEPEPEHAPAPSHWYWRHVLGGR